MINKQKTKTKSKAARETKKLELTSEVNPLPPVSSRARRNRNKRNKKKRNRRWRNNNMSNHVGNQTITKIQFRFLAHTPCRLAVNTRHQDCIRVTIRLKMVIFIVLDAHTKGQILWDPKKRQSKPSPRVSPHNHED